MTSTETLDPLSPPNDLIPQPAFLWKLWIYTNYDCNLKCSYCVAKSGPSVPRRALGLADVHRLVDETVGLGFSDIFFTGGELSSSTIFTRCWLIPPRASKPQF